jgi:amino acid transporter
MSLDTSPSPAASALTPAATAPTAEVGVERLQRGVLALPGIIASTMANIGPAMSFFFGFALIASTSGVASPLTILAAAVGIAFVGNTVAEFSRTVPSTGFWVTFIRKGLGPIPATAFAVVFLLSLLPGAASLLAIQGGWLSDLLQRYAHVHIPWQSLCALLTVVLFIIVQRGIGISTKAAGALFGFEMLVLIGVSVMAIVVHRGHLLLTPFEPSHLAGGLKGLGLGFPLAVYMFIGWENSAGLAEETDNPRRNVPRAIFFSIATMVAGYLLFAYATVVSFGYDTKALGSSSVPFIDMAQHLLGAATFVAYLAGFTSIMGCIVAAVNSQSRVVFGAAREGVLPRPLARVTRRTRTPVVAFATYLGAGLTIALTWGLHIDPVTFYAEGATLATIPLILGYIATNVSLIVYARRELQSSWSFLKHLVMPLAGIAVVGFPLYELAKPGQPAPYNLFPLISLAMVAFGFVYAVIRTRRDPGLAERIGSVVADH